MSDILQSAQNQPHNLLPAAPPSDSPDIPDLPFRYGKHDSPPTPEPEPVLVISSPGKKNRFSKTLIFAVLLFLLTTLPLTVYFVSQQRQLADLRSKAKGPYPGGTQCVRDPDCASGKCQGTPPDRYCTTATTPPPAATGKPGGSTCSTNKDCASGTCRGSPPDRYCTAVTSTPPPAATGKPGGSTCTKDKDCSSGSCLGTPPNRYCTTTTTTPPPKPSPHTREECLAAGKTQSECNSLPTRAPSPRSREECLAAGNTPSECNPLPSIKKDSGNNCTLSIECVSNYCDGPSGICKPAGFRPTQPPGKDNGYPCDLGSECKSGYCDGPSGICRNPDNRPGQTPPATPKPIPVGVVPTPPSTTPAASGTCTSSCCTVGAGQSGWRFSCPEGLTVGTLPDDPNVGARCMSNPTPIGSGRACVTSDPCVAEQIDVCNSTNPSNCNVTTLKGFIIKPKDANCGGTITITSTPTQPPRGDSPTPTPEGENPTNTPTPTSIAGGTCELIKVYDAAGTDITQAIKTGTIKLAIGEEIMLATTKGNATKARFRIQGITSWAENDPSKTTVTEYRLTIHIPSTLTQVQGTFEVEVFINGRWK